MVGAAVTGEREKEREKEKEREREKEKERQKEKEREKERETDDRMRYLKDADEGPLPPVISRLLGQPPTGSIDDQSMYYVVLDGERERERDSERESGR